MLIVEYDVTGETVLVHGDPAGLLSLAARLQRLAAGTPVGGADHAHLMSPVWGGAELAAESEGVGARVVHHLKLTCRRPDEGGRA